MINMTFNSTLFYNINKQIAKDDQIFQGNLNHYLYVGYSTINCIQSAMQSAGKDHSAIRQILDLPCGHGRITRWLAAVFPESEITACDLEKSGVDFCKEQFNACPVYSDVDLEKIKINKKFDLIWCGSLFTHINDECQIKLLNLVYSLLSSQGILIFTTHGRFVIFRGQNGFNYGLSPNSFNKIVKEFQSFGRGYEDYFPGSNYGISAAKPSHIFDLIESFPDLRVVLFQEKGWDHHQDVFACMKDRHFNEVNFDYSTEFKQLFG